MTRVRIGTALLAVRVLGATLLLAMLQVAGGRPPVMGNGRQKTAGLLLVWLCCLLILPVGVFFVQASAADVAEATLFATMFLPGVVTGWATGFVFGRPVWRYLRS